MRRSPSPATGDDHPTVGILSFEVAAAMSRAVHLYRSLSDAEISRLRSHTLSSYAVRTLVSSSERHLLSLSLAEKLDSLNRVAAVTARLGRRCRRHPALSGFEHVYSDLLSGRLDPARLGFLSKDIDGAFRKMDRFVAELEASAKKLSVPTDDAQQVLDQKPQWQRQDVQQLRNASLWNQTFDKVVLLLARAVCTIHSRIQVVFAEACPGLESLGFHESRQLSHCRPGSVPRQTVPSSAGPGGGSLHNEGARSLNCAASPGRLLMECLSLSSSAALHDGFDEEQHFERESNVIGAPPSREEKCGINGKLWFGPKSSLTMLALPSTVGGSALALHYANVIIIMKS
ncbi:hypothetical protein J5N97_023163 [Dioscorea zingiberensis]|uniref:DUF3475 domain-containing protein n=1 Tax=Dioscorea zingiberensis TaxID=325984 RepID=A0A9D5CBX7_9LILI|nr:hypothetical protein J5N97_023163 [Dioscorea zingiberensis]